jgi:hypothetical protein
MKSACVIGILTAVAAMAAPATLSNVTFNKDVLPVLQKNCQTCHRPGEVAPMSLLTYQDARPYAKAIKTAVLQKKMPPWSADPKVGHFSNERRLTDQEINLLVAWSDNGAVEGDAKDRPAAVQFSSGWQIKPDVVVEMSKDQEIPATGIIDNYYVIVKGNFTEDTWLTAAEVRPSNRGVVHHMRVWVRPPDSHWLEGAPYGEPVPLNFGFGAPRGGPRVDAAPKTQVQEILAKYNPGVDPQYFDGDHSAKLIPKGSDIVFETHYTTIGKPATDRSKIGLVLAKAHPERRYITAQGTGNANWVIPAGDSNFEVHAESVLDFDAQLASFQPHMHLRGKDYMVTAIYPSGESEVLLKTRFDFNWQMWYFLAQPKLLPKGTKLQAVSHFDNSPNNPLNPDPSQNVKFGVQSDNEMSLCYYGLIVAPNVQPDKVFQSAQFFRFD